MDCQTILNSRITFNKQKRIGRVIYIVEGNKTEVDLLKKIYNELLGYNYISSNRDGTEFKFVKDEDKYSVVYVLNSKNSNISSIKNSEELEEEVTDFIRKNYDMDFSIENAAVFYLFDRDYKSNQDFIVKELIDVYANSREGIHDYDKKGLLLLSYPSIEAFLGENFLKKYFKHDFGLGYVLKHYLSNRHIKIENITEQTLNTGINRMHTMLSKMHIEDYDIDDFAHTNKRIFDYQENYLSQTDNYKLLSLLAISLVDLGIVDFEEKELEEN